MHVVTIAARNYLSRVRALAGSLARHAPGNAFTVLLVDALPGEVASSAECRVITPEDLPLAADEFRRMAMIYGVTELSTALKPWALELLLDEGAQTAVYLDPDIVVYDRLDEIETAAAHHGIVLTPHRETPMPRDGLRPTDADMMSAGTFNLGFIGISAAARPMLAWWQERLARRCFFKPDQMLFVDQRWVDLVPGLWDYTVLRDPGYNVAYWNLDSRPLYRDGPRVLVDGAPLRFFHFSGYSPSRPWILSKYIADRPRITLDEHPVVRELCDEYGALIAAENDEWHDAAYRWAVLRDGTPITQTMRDLYLRALGREDAPAPPVPFRGDDAEMIAWFRLPIRTCGRVNQFLYEIWQGRSDLRQVFSDPLGNDDAQFVRWAWQNLGRDLDPGVSWLLPDLPHTSAPTTVSTDRPGVNLAGYLTAELGLGQAGRLLAAALHESGLPYGTHVSHGTRSRAQARYDAVDTNVRYPVTVSVVTADRFRAWAAQSDADLRTDRHVVGVWAWETEDLASADEALPLVDEIWTLSDYTRRVIERTTDKAVHVVPLPVLEPEAGPEVDLTAFGIPDRPYFLFAFDHFSVMQRKNPLGLVEAFRRAFPAGDGPTLVIKTVNAFRCKSDRSRLARQIRQLDVGTDDVVVIDRYLDHDVVGAVMSGASAYVSLHRAEGFGLTMAESMVRGVPVIATGYSGNLDFMSSDNSLLVPYRRVRVGQDGRPYPADSHWADPDLDVAAQHMRWIAANPDDARALGKHGRDSVLRTHGIARTVGFLQQRVGAASAPPVALTDLGVDVAV